MDSACAGLVALVRDDLFTQIRIDTTLCYFLGYVHIVVVVGMPDIVDQSERLFQLYLILRSSW